MTDRLLNLISELEFRLTGSSASPRLSEAVSAEIPDASTYVFMLFDGLGSHQLDHPAAASLAAADQGPISAMFPATTTTNLSTVATGKSPRSHGVIGHHMWLPSHNRVVNVLRWITPGGGDVTADTSTFLQGANLWERLKKAGIEPITVQPGPFEGSPLSNMLYRGCRIEPVWTEAETIAATRDLAQSPGRFIFTYLPNVDIAAHIRGQGSSEYANALRLAARVWDGATTGLPDHAAVVGTADHGHVDYEPGHKIVVESRSDCEFFGDPRALYVRTDNALLGPKLAEGLPATWHGADELITWFGDGPMHPELKKRMPSGVLLPNEGFVLVPSNMDNRLIGYHGGFDPRETNIPLFVAPSR